MTSQMSHKMTISAKKIADQVTQVNPFWFPKITLKSDRRYSGTFLKYFLYIVHGWGIIDLEKGSER